MRIVAGSAGSRGDVMPVMEIASELKKRGHDIHFFTPGQFVDEAKSRGLRVDRFASTYSHGLMQNLGPGWQSTKQTADWTRLSMEEQLDVLLTATQNADALLTMANEVGAPTIAEYRRIPHFRVCVLPCLPGDQPPPVQPLQTLPPILNRVLWSGVELGTMYIFGKSLNKKRKILGLRKIRRFADYAAGYSRNLLAIDPLLAPPCRGWKYGYTYTGYPFGGNDEQLSEEVEAFLAAGPPPVYIGFGSVCIPDPKRTTRIILDALKETGDRALIACGWTKLGKGFAIPENVLLLEEAPHRKLFPRMAGIIHHGGSGTTHNAARAGKPQAIIPHMLDQYYWGRRIYNLGIGPEPVPEVDITKRKLVRILRELHLPAYRRNAEAVSGLMQKNGVSAIGDEVEKALGVFSLRYQCLQTACRQTTL